MAPKLLLGSYVVQDPWQGHENPVVSEASQQVFMRYSHDLNFSSLIPSLATSYEARFESLDVKTETTVSLGPWKIVYKPFRINRWLDQFFPKATNRSEFANLWIKMEEVRFAPQIGGELSDILDAFPSVEPNSLQIIKCLAHGAYGVVDKVDWPSRGTFVIKRFDKNKEQELLHEAKIHFRLDHPHIVKPHGYVRQASTRTFGIIMESMDGDLDTWIKNTGPLSEIAAVDVMLQAATALMYMHAFGLIHRDVKPANMLVQSSASFSSGLEVKLGDFGLARFVDDGILTARLGTPFYWAPEVIQGEEDTSCAYTEKADVYSFAMSFYKVLTGETPLGKYEGLSLKMFYEKIRGGKSIVPGLKRAGKRPSLRSKIDSSLAKLIQQCWHDDPAERPPFDVICWVLEIIQARLTGSDLSSSLSRKPEVYPMKLDLPSSSIFDRLIPNRTNDQSRLGQSLNESSSSKLLQDLAMTYLIAEDY